MFNSILIPLLSLVTLSVQQHDPLKDFCRLFGHQTAVVDRHVYIDGGMVNWTPLSASSTNYTSTWLRTTDLDNNPLGFPQESILNKNASVPSVAGGVLWPDSSNKILYMYGGEYDNGKPDDLQLWSYDIIYNTWNVTNARGVDDMRRAAWGAGAVAQDKAMAYYYGGWLTNASVPGYTTRTALSSMLIYDMIGNAFRNDSGPDGTARAEGSMTYIPAGDGGFLIYFGGIESNGTSVTGTNMTNIFVYDIANSKWYTQTASGDIPSPRRRFCAGATWAQDRSSYNIYMYGGAAIDKGVGYGDVYVLSLPSFRWIKFYGGPEEDIGNSQHHSLSCDVLQNSQMIVMGGYFPNSTDCDAPTIYGQHGLDLGMQNTVGAKWVAFNASLTEYKVPPIIAKTIGGGPTGGATAAAPTGGFQAQDLEVLFTRHYTPVTRGHTRDIPTATGTNSPGAGSPSKSNKAAIIGGAVGGTIGGLLLLLTVGFCLLCSRRRHKQRLEESKPRRKSDDSMEPAVTYPKSLETTRGMDQYPQPTHTSPPPADYNWAHPPHPAPAYAGGLHHRTPSHQSLHELASHDLPTSPVYNGDKKVRVPSSHFSPTRHEMPAQEWPLGNAKPHYEMKPMKAPPVPAIDPYFLQNPPKEPGSASGLSRSDTLYSMNMPRDASRSPGAGLSRSDTLYSQNLPREASRSPSAGLSRSDTLYSKDLPPEPSRSASNVSRPDAYFAGHPPNRSSSAVSKPDQYYPKDPIKRSSSAVSRDEYSQTPPQEPLSAISGPLSPKMF